VLTEPLTLAGPTSLHLVASSTAADTNWIVKMADVAPDGSEAIITNGYLRASHRELDVARSREGVPYHTHTNPTPIEPGAPYVYEIEIWPTAYQLAAGHRLQIRVTSYDVPTHAPWSVAFDIADPASVQIRPMLPATNEILQGGADPSYLLIPVADVGVP
jgi:putative CocE/NonD family hydrolase